MCLQEKETPMRVMFQCLGVLTLAAVCVGAQIPAQQQRPYGEAVKDILDLADHLQDMDVAKRAKAIVTQHDSCDISRVFTARQRGGAGIGAVATKPTENSIDHLVRKWAGGKPPTAEELKKHQYDLVRVSRVLQTMAELAPFRMPPYPARDKRIDEWRKVAQDFKSITRDLRHGIEEADAVRVRTTVVRLQQTCNRCHELAF